MSKVVTSLAVLLLVLPSSASAAEFWRLPKAQAECILANVDGYLSSGQKVLMIVAAGCPEPDPSKALAMTTRNSALPNLAIAADMPEADSIIVYNADELQCLANMELDLTGQIVLLPKDPEC